MLLVVAASGLAGNAWTGIPHLATAVVGAVLIVAGGALGARGILDLGNSLTVFPRPRAGAELVTAGAYRLARHPIYGGIILGAWGWGLLTAALPALAAAAFTTIFFDLKSRREEGWLAERYPDYRGYRAHTRRLIPWLY